MPLEAYLLRDLVRAPGLFREVVTLVETLAFFGIFLAPEV